ncbi:MAG: hypothetical protein Tp185DCM00d2C31949991_15 [Prokaryotic dsDNA virus sp.]|nr:MAG: hypothetical protein Tp185DCM00d2C31949991_15 [Prokaryotic dsDNA virus sp.]QDP63755.1 MAG: hypothetical protein Unbinned2480contig1002_9 [Prokaryotic dsDNA virus sp.]QDP63831.1 MAG: hypothetical protein GOVbin2429_15 [Prokaryotic dsDNA virus sp.]|tara:strand:+ start:38171 stop:38368 length:198 start_codon:yes stop_codon:yes gene_type:complete
MLFSIFDVLIILAGIFYYIVMGAGFVSDVNKVQGHTFSFIDLFAVALWPAFMFFRSLLGFFEEQQ